MPIGIPQTDALFNLFRGAAELPQGVRSEGLYGAFNAFNEPEKYAEQNKAKNFEKDYPELGHVKQLIQSAQSNDDLAPAWGLYQKVQGEAIHQGLTEDSLAYKQAFGPVDKALGAKQRELIGLPPLKEAGSQYAQAGARLGDKELQQTGTTLQGIYNAQQTGAGAAATAEEKQRENVAGGPEETVREKKAIADFYQSGGSGGQNAEFKQLPIDRELFQIDNQITAVLTKLNAPPSRTEAATMGEGQAVPTRDASALQTLIDRHNDAIRRGATGDTVTVQQEAGKGFSIRPVSPKEAQGGGPAWAPDIGTGGFSLPGVGEIPEGSVPPQGAAPAQKQQAPTYNIQPSPMPEAMAPELPNQPLAAPRRIELPPDVRGARSTSQIMAYYLRQGMNPAQALQATRAAGLQLKAEAPGAAPR